MTTDVLPVLGVVIGGVGVVVAAVSGALGAIFGYRAVVASRMAVAEARTARREDRLVQELARLDRLVDLLKRMWAILNRARTWRLPPASPATEAAQLEGEQEMDALLYQLRAALAVFDRHDFPLCRHLAESKDGRAAFGAGTAIQDAEDEVIAALKGCREALRALAKAAE